MNTKGAENFELSAIDFNAMALESESHDADAIEVAVKIGDNVWELDSGLEGNDDLLIFPVEVTADVIVGHIEDFYGVGEFADPPEQSRFDLERPKWKLRVIAPAEMAARWPAA